ncbi:DUF6151 family protein [Myxococcota bacterium]|nr:DUF6151 family protein [Myxococcota bacterium]
MSSHPLRCRCGRLQGVVAPTHPANRCICYCRDCRAFARHLGHTEDVLDAHGGSEIVQVPPANVAITQGLEELACLKLTDKGLMRWYARCCRTPIGNTVSTRDFSFVGLGHTCLRAGGGDLDASFGPVTMIVNGKSAIGGALRDRGVLAGITKIMGFVAKARLTGSHRQTPFFDPATGASIVTPLVLTDDERARAYV